MSGAAVATPLPSLMLRVAEPVAREWAEVEERLAQLVSPEGGGLAWVAYHHILEAGGKRLRPLLALLSSAAAGGQPAEAIGVATAVEVIHLASLIHDDVIDEADERRGRPSTRRELGNRTSILVGDLLIAEIFYRLSMQFERAALSVLAGAVVRMCQAEIGHSDCSADAAPDEQAYFRNIEGKTAALMSASCELGAVATGIDTAAAPLRRYGENLGLAFQITDDLLDLYGDPERTGKPARQDLLRGQWTLPVIAALRDAAPDTEARLRDLLTRSAQGDTAAADEAAQLVADLGGQAYAMQRVGTCITDALAELAALPESPARASLEALARFVPERDS